VCGVWFVCVCGVCGLCVCVCVCVRCGLCVCVCVSLGLQGRCFSNDVILGSYPAQYNKFVSAFRKNQ
jgi:hypothetical protein